MRQRQNQNGSAPATAERPAIDLIIVNYFSATDLGHCLVRLGPWHDGLVWIVDNSSDPAEAVWVAELVARYHWTRLIPAEHNLGFGRACNLAFERSSAPLVLLLNPDARIDADSIYRLALTLLTNPQLGAVSPKTYWNQQKTFLIPVAHGLTPWLMLTEMVMSWSPLLARVRAARYLVTMQRLMARAEWFRVPFLSGAALMVKRSAAVAAGGLFDPAYFMFYEDTDLSLRLRRSGHLLGIEPQAEAVHEYRHKPYKTPLMADSRRIYLQKCFPAFHWLSQRAPGLLNWGKKTVPEDWFDAVLPALQGPGQLASETGGAGVMALTVSPLGIPCVFRDSQTGARPLNQAEWDLLEPGPCVAMLSPARAESGSARRFRAVFFHRSATPGADGRQQPESQSAQK